MPLISDAGKAHFKKYGVQNSAVDLLIDTFNLVYKEDGMLVALQDLEKWFCDIGLDDDHSKEDGGLPDELVNARAAIAEALILLEESKIADESEAK